jgi:hypothetical protein
MLHTKRGKAAGLLFLMALLGGCGGSDGGGARLAPARGRVIFKGEGVSAANIYFMPDADKGNNGAMASAILQEDGSFDMETYPKGKGVAPGAYKVTLDLGRRRDKELDRFRRVETTPLKVEVSEEGDTNLLFDLSKPNP